MTGMEKALNPRFQRCWLALNLRIKGMTYKEIGEALGGFTAEYARQTVHLALRIAAHRFLL